MYPFYILRSSNLDARRRADVDPLHVRVARVAVGAERSLPHERQGALPHDHRHVLSARPIRRKNALQRLSTAPLDGHVSILHGDKVLEGEEKKAKEEMKFLQQT